MKRCTLETTISPDGENDFDVIITYDYEPPLRERGPSYSCGGEPAEPAETHIISVVFANNGQQVPDLLAYHCEENERLYQCMIENAEEI